MGPAVSVNLEVGNSETVPVVSKSYELSQGVRQDELVKGEYPHLSSCNRKVIQLDLWSILH